MDDMISKQGVLRLLDAVPSEEFATKAMLISGVNALPSAKLAQNLTNGCTDTISRAAVGDALNRIETSRNASWYEFYQKALTAVGTLPSAQPGQQNARVFQGIIVEYPSISAYPEYEGKPYFSIKYTENGQEFIGYGTYKPEVLSEYLKEYFTPSAQPWCEDAVSRTAAIDALPYLLDYEGFKGESGYVSKNLVRTMLKGLPSVTPKQPGWIPVTEKPIEGGQYIVTLKDDKEVWTDIVEWNPTFGGRWQAEFFDCEYRDIDNVVAWQPLPTPYREGERDE